MIPAFQPRNLLYHYFLAAQVLSLIVGAVGAALGTVGFAIAPYQNAMLALVTGSVLTLLALSNTGRLRIPSGAGGPYIFCLAVLTLCGLMLGVLNGNARIYVISTFVYWYNFLLFLLILPWLDMSPDLFRRIRRMLIVTAVATILLGGKMADGTTVFLLVACAMHLVYENAYRAAFWAALPFVLNFSDLNRGSLLAFGVILTLAAITSGKSLKIVLAVGGAATLFVVLFSVDLSLILTPGTQLYRRLDEVQKLLSGSTRIEDIIALQQRLLEIRLVNEIQNEAMGLLKVFGQGFGRTIDMSAVSDDASVLNAAFLGGNNVHNIHSLPHSVLLRYGYFGVALLALLCINILRNVVLLGLSGQRSFALLICVYYPLARMMESFPASNNFFTDFILVSFVVVANRMLRTPGPALGPQTGLKGARVK